MSSNEYALLARFPGANSISFMSGRVLKVLKADYGRGYNQVEVDRFELPATGVLYYTVATFR